MASTIKTADVAALQRRLNTMGFDAGPDDGDAGPQTFAAMYRAMGCARPRSIAYGDASAIHFPNFGIARNALRLAHFFGQMAHESGGFFFIQEIWGPTPVQLRYEGSRGLGNTQPGDGKRFMGRGIIQLTGRFNYGFFGKRIGVDLIARPELAADEATAVHIACDYWVQRKCAAFADADDLIGVTKRINGGTNGLEDRRRRTNRAKGFLGEPADS